MADLLARPTAGPELGLVVLSGRLDGTAAPVLETAYADAVADSAPVVLLDFTAVDYINSTGIAAIVGLLGHARRDGREVRVAGLSEHYRHIFEITRLADFVTYETQI